jgi:RNA-directed DNA polymerase
VGTLSREGDANSENRRRDIPTFEDKVLQRAVAMILEAVYEQDFLNCSYGFRPKRSAHQALLALWQGIGKFGGWVVEVDIRGFFDNLDHDKLREILDHRVRDSGLRRLIDNWLKAGVMEDGLFRRSSEGTPQGGVISPILANVYLHEVVDRWFHSDAKPAIGNDGIMVRYADDFVMVFRTQVAARKIYDVLPKRFARFGLELHPDKTKLIHFHRPESRLESELNETFDFLGFTHYWAAGRKVKWVVKRRTAKSRLKRALHAIKDWCKENRHRSLAEQREGLARRLRGHFNYYGITGNYEAIHKFAHTVQQVWKKWLSRRSQRACITYDKMVEILNRYPLPAAKISPSYIQLTRCKPLI